jgi:hypothetical protein
VGAPTNSQRGRRGHDGDVVAALGEQAQQRGGLIGGDAAAHAEDDPHDGISVDRVSVSRGEQTLVDLAQRDRQRLLVDLGLDERADVVEQALLQLRVVGVDLPGRFAE